MAYFNYRAIDEESRINKGRIEASDENELEERLNSKGLTLIEATKSRFILHGKLRLTSTYQHFSSLQKYHFHVVKDQK